MTIGIRPGHVTSSSPKACIVNDSGNQVAGAGWSAVYMGDGRWRITVAAGTPGVLDPETASFLATVPLTDILGEVVGGWLDSVVQGRIEIEVMDDLIPTPANGDDIVAFAGFLGAADYSKGAALGSILFRANRVMAPIRRLATAATWGMPTPAILNGLLVDTSWVTKGTGTPTTINVSERGGLTLGYTGYPNVLADDSHFCIGGYNESNIGVSDIVFDVCARAYILPKAG